MFSPWLHLARDDDRRRSKGNKNKRGAGEPAAADDYDKTTGKGGGAALLLPPLCGGVGVRGHHAASSFRLRSLGPGLPCSQSQAAGGLAVT